MAKNQYSIYDYMQKTPGFLQILKSAKQYLGAWGIVMDALQQSFLDVLTNRMARNTSDSGAALIEEFGLPNAEILTYLKWRYASLKGTSEGIFEMMNALGHPNVSIYKLGTRLDSPYMTYDTANFPLFITRYSQNNTAFSQLNALFSATQDTNSYYDSSGLSNNWYTVVVWDCFAPNGAMSIQGDGYTIAGSADLGWTNANSPISNTPGSQVDPTYNYFGLTNQSVLMDVARWGKNIKNLPVELILCYPNMQYSGQSLINSAADPVIAPAIANQWQIGDVIERIRLNIDDVAPPTFMSMNQMNSTMFGPTGSLLGTTLEISTFPNQKPDFYVLNAADVGTQQSFLDLFGTPTVACQNSKWPGLLAYVDQDNTLILQTAINASSNYDYSAFVAVYPVTNLNDVNTVQTLKSQINQAAPFTLFSADIDPSNNLIIYNYGPYGTRPGRTPSAAAIADLAISHPNMIQNSSEVNSLVTFDELGNLYIFGNLCWTADPYLGIKNKIGIIQSTAYKIINPNPILVFGEGTANAVLGLEAGTFT